MTNKDPDRLDVENIIARFSSIRKEKNLSYEKLAEASGLSREAPRMVETGNSIPTILTCLKICKGMQIKLSDVLRELGL